jgi:hypothetical protein
MDGCQLIFQKHGSTRRGKNTSSALLTFIESNFTVGREIELNPRQQGSRLNYFIYPYVEVDGVPFPNVANALSFSEVSSKQTAAR